MKTYSILKTVTLAMVAVLGFTACETKESARARSFQVYQTLNLLNKDGKPFQLQAGTYTGKFDVLLIVDGDRRGLVFKAVDSNFAIPFQVASNFYFGSGNMAAASTGQNFGIIQTTSNYQSASDSKYTSTESCDIARTEQVCDRDNRGHERCFDRTVTSQGSRQVEHSTSGYTEDVNMKLVTASGDVVASIDFENDQTSRNENGSTCQ